MKTDEVKKAYDEGIDSVLQMIRTIENTKSKYKSKLIELQGEPRQNRVKRRPVYCMTCHHEFLSRNPNPHCGKCGSYKVVEYNDVPLRFREDHFADIAESMEKKVRSMETQLLAFDDVRQALQDDQVIRRSELVDLENKIKAYSGEVDSRLDAIEVKGAHI